MKRADLIFVLDHGRIVQRGKHDDLLEQGGLYGQIYDLQLKDQEKFRREIMFLDSPEEEQPIPLHERIHAERPDTKNKLETQPVRVSAVK